MPNRKNPSIADDEIARFSRVAPEWWNPDGPLRPLHRLNPVRLSYLRARIVAHYKRNAASRQPLLGLSALDVGCGGGLLCEPLARLGARVTGLDASDEAITEARRHAQDMKIAIDYRTGSVEQLARGAARYDVITALEIVEHVADRESFIASLAKLLKPRGLLILSTVNRTPKSFLLGIVAAEYILRWVPRGTHRWSKFVRPSELVKQLETQKLAAVDLTGMVFNPLKNEFALSKDDCGVNYLLTAVKNERPFDFRKSYDRKKT